MTTYARVSVSSALLEYQRYGDEMPFPSNESPRAGVVEETPISFAWHPLFNIFIRAALTLI